MIHYIEASERHGISLTVPTIIGIGYFRCLPYALEIVEMEELL